MRTHSILSKFLLAAFLSASVAPTHAQVVEFVEAPVAPLAKD